MGMLNLVINIINALLMVIVFVGGIILLAVRKKDHGRGANLGIAGCVVLLVGFIGQVGVSFSMSTLIDKLGRTAYEIVLPVGTGLGTLAQAVGISLLIFGVVARRTPQPAAAGQPQTWPTQPGHHAQHGQPGWPQPDQGQHGWPQPGHQPDPGWSQPGGHGGQAQPGWAPQQPGQQAQPGGQPPQQGWQPPSQGYQPPSEQ
ncbi:hypothetical protein ACFMQL_04735 [Nonomuraea fastidiosa]|uniref:hypothetical protein n=1 Tax=Nonomuraea TaxID=83681 RepID=UPI00324743EF